MINKNLLFPTLLVFGASAQAQATAGAYVKPRTWPDTADPDYMSNKGRMVKFINEADVSSAAIEAGQQLLDHCKTLVFKKLTDSLTEFESKILDISNSEFVTPSDFGLIACIPDFVSRAKTKAEVHTKLAFASGGNVGTIGNRLTLDINVLDSVYSRNYAIYYIKALTIHDQSIFFANKQPLDRGKFNITGTVAAFTDANTTKLSRVKFN